ncbi:MAG TPA: DUF4097 family beta strand repeat-containing protein [Thermoanaerobaculia bacterium]|nr:DUF4097 family beta strand repeat-containing protein [Thermoanaerobaculia bacterium]
MRVRVAHRLSMVIAGLFLPALFVSAETRLEKSLRLEPGGRFSLDTDMGSVTVTGTNAPGARLVITSRRRDLDDLLRFTWREDTGAVSVTARRRHGHVFGWFNSGGDSVHWEIQVPGRTGLDIDTSGGAIKIASLQSDAKLETSGGRIEVRDLVGDLDAHTSGGGIDLGRIRGRMRVETSGGGIEGTELDGAIDADTSGGSVELDRVAGDIRARSSGGGIQIRDAGGRVDADTSGGSIVASFARGNARGGTLSTSGGGIQVAIDPAVGLRIDASGNSVHADLPITVHGAISRGKLQGTLGGGGELLRLHTSGGGVRIQGL